MNPWTTKQVSWLKEQYNAGRKVSEFWMEFEPLFGVKRTKCAFYQAVKKLHEVDGTLTRHYRKEWSEEEIARLVRLHGWMKNPGIARVMGRTIGSVEGQIQKMRNAGELPRKKPSGVCWLREDREGVLENEL